MLVNQQTGKLVDLSLEKFITEMKGLFNQYPKKELLIDKIVEYIAQG